jgi:hypothetical protein
MGKGQLLPILQPTQPEKKPLPPEYEQLRDAATRFFYACGSRKLCGACFEGNLMTYTGAFVLRPGEERVIWDKQYRSRGCCIPCKNLGETACTDKPLGCAAYVCYKLEGLIPGRLLGRAQQLKKKVWAVSASIGSEGMTWDRKRKFLKEERLRMRALAHSFNRMTRWIELTGWHPNWPLVEVLTKAIPDSLVGRA